MNNPSEKVAIITGAGTGIGEATTLEFFQYGYNVVLAGRRPDKLNSVIDKLPPQPNKALAIPTDVADPSSVKNLFVQTKKIFSRVDILFNNAGISLGGAIDEIQPEDWIKAVNINLNGMFFCTQEACEKYNTPHSDHLAAIFDRLT